jgi:hypothetical protein
MALNSTHSLVNVNFIMNLIGWHDFELFWEAEVDSEHIIELDWTFVRLMWFNCSGSFPPWGLCLIFKVFFFRCVEKSECENKLNYWLPSIRNQCLQLTLRDESSYGVSLDRKLVNQYSNLRKKYFTYEIMLGRICITCYINVRLQYLPKGHVPCNSACENSGKNRFSTFPLVL